MHRRLVGSRQPSHLHGHSHRSILQNAQINRVVPTNSFTINTSEISHELTNKKFPYQSIDSGKFYKKIESKLSANSNVSFYENLKDFMKISIFT